jgi:arginase
MKSMPKLVTVCSFDLNAGDGDLIGIAVRAIRAFVGSLLENGVLVES